MRKIEIKKSLITIDGKPAQEISLAQIVMQVMQASPDGMNIGDVRRAMRVIDVAEACYQRGGEGHILLEDDDFAYLQRRWQETKFPIATRAVVDLDDAITNAVQFDPNGPDDGPTTSRRGKR